MQTRFDGKFFVLRLQFLKNKVKYTMSCQKLSISDLEHIAKLARIDLSESEKKTFLPQLESVLNYFDILKEVDTDNVAPTYQVNDTKNVFREDLVKDSLSSKEALSSASQTKDDYFVVPGTIIK